ncbi:hypothetical protein AA637_08160 [Cyanobacterium sp. HL-69]|nr:hypothetical protein AA637_08160 [Cyanobacterium sp. HL-69]
MIISIIIFINKVDKLFPIKPKWQTFIGVINILLILLVLLFNGL